MQGEELILVIDIEVWYWIRGLGVSVGRRDRDLRPAGGILPQHVKVDEGIHLGLLLLLLHGHSRVFSPGREVGERTRGNVLLGG